MPSAYIPSNGFEKELMEESGGSLLDTAADEIASAANEMAPRIMPRNEDAVEVQSDDGETAVVNTDYGGHLAEWGSKNNPPFAPLRRAVRAKGYRLTES